MPKINLVVPSERYLPSFLAALSEFEKEGETLYQGHAIANLRAKPDTIIPLIRQMELNFSPDRVPDKTLWGIVDDQFVGRISIRGALTRLLWDWGGHIGYDVRPSARRRGYATAMLKDALPHAYSMGHLRVLISCRSDNLASKKVIENSGAVAIENFQRTDANQVMLRYWLPTYQVSHQLQNSIQESVAYLSSDLAHQNANQDPYWPKWDSPWWHMHALREIGQAHQIPKPIFRTLFAAMEKQYPPFFPFTEAEMPPGSHPYRSSQCHCQVGSQALLAMDCQEPLEEHLPKLIEWFAKYQLPDGGLNCDNDVYPRPNPSSSFVSTAPVLEACLQGELLGCKIDPEVTDRMARYFLERQICRSRRTGQPAQAAWQRPIFPRFYEFDIIRGTCALVTWMHQRGHRIQENWLGELIQQITSPLSTHPEDKNPFRTHHNSFSIIPQADQTWTDGTSTSFPLLDYLSQREFAEPFIQSQKNRIIWSWRALGEQN